MSLEERDEILSAAGHARRAAILQTALLAVRRRRARRRALTGLAGTVTIAAIALLWSHGSGLRIPAGPSREGPGISGPLAEAPLVEIVHADPTVLARLTPPVEPPRWQSIDDHTLLTELADCGQPSGLARINGRIFLLAAATQ